MENEFLTKQDLIILASMLAISNMGMERPSSEEVQRMKKAAPQDVDSCVIGFAQQYIESDEIQDAFVEEARAWHDHLSKYPSKLRSSHKHILVLYQEA